jgi:hypothetical protein
MKLTYEELTAGLDQLYMMPLLKVETIEDRMKAVENYIAASGWSWDQIVDEMAKPESVEISAYS